MSGLVLALAVFAGALNVERFQKAPDTVGEPRGLLTGSQAESAAPVWQPFYQAFVACRKRIGDESCEPGRFQIAGPLLCHAQRKAIDLFSIRCADGAHDALKNGKFDALARCLKGAGGRTLTIWQQCLMPRCPARSDYNAWHRNHLHFSIGCPGPPW